MKTTAVVILSLLTRASSFQPQQAPKRAATLPKWTMMVPPRQLRDAAAATLVAGSLVLSSPFPAYASSLDDAAVGVADATYPIISKLQKKDVAPVLSKAIGVALTGDPVAVLKVAKSGNAALLSTDPAKLIAALKSVDVALGDALKTGGVLPPLSDVEDVARKAADALATTDKALVKETFGNLVAAGNSADKLAVLGVLADGSKLASKINPADAAAASGAVLNLLKESGAQ